MGPEWPDKREETGFPAWPGLGENFNLLELSWKAWQIVRRIENKNVMQSLKNNVLDDMNEGLLIYKRQIKIRMISQ